MPVWFRRWVGGLLVVPLLVWGLAWLVPLPAALQRAHSVEVRWSDGTTAHVFLSPDEKWRIPVDLDEVDPAYLDALVRLEDGRFAWHWGVDGPAVVRAALQDVRAGEVVSGASTLTMQLARLLEPRPRTLRSKLIEALRAVQLEIRLSKREILSEYLTFVPYGGNVEGLATASLWTFGHSAAHLSPAEIATLLAVPQDPNGRRPSPAHTAALTAARDRLAARLFDAAAVEEVARTPVPDHVTPVPRGLPHAGPWMRDHTLGARTIRTTLDRGVQRVVDRTLDRFRASLQERGIHNAAVVVVDPTRGHILGLAGNLDAGDRTHAGSMVALDVPRSPGSTLKPLLYAAALDAGLVLPSTLVPDVPASWGAYRPQNYDGSWSGMVAMEDALSRSLNVPFVSLLARFGVDPFLALLRRGGVSHLDPRPGRYGLALVAGGVEISPLEVTGLYTALVTDGKARSLRWRPEAGEVAPTALVSAGSAWLTRRALRLRDRPDFPSRAQVARVPAELVWKTGTSFGNRDAWAIGAGEHLLASVWLGNLDQSPSAHLVGAEAAAPVLFDLLEGLRDGRTSRDVAPAGVAPVQICALSGALPGPACPSTRATLALPGTLPPQTCPLHTAVDVDPVSGLRVTPDCAEVHPAVPRTVVVWPAGVRRWLGERFRDVPDLPALAPGCTPPTPRAAPRIRSPGPGQVAVLIPGVPADQQEIPFEAEADAAVSLSWFVDGEFVGRASADERVWWVPRVGEHRVVVMDEAGLTREQSLTVR